MYSVFNPGPHWKPTFVVWATLVKYCEINKKIKKYLSLTFQLFSIVLNHVSFGHPWYLLSSGVQLRAEI